MDQFERPYWSKLQVELWVCTRSREAVGLAEHAPGRTRLADFSIGHDGLRDEASDQDTPMCDDEIELIGTGIINYGSVCPFEDAREDVIVALSKGEVQQHEDRSSGVKFFEREEVLRRWPDLRLETLRAQTGPLSLAEGVALLVRGRPASKEAWRRLRRRQGRSFPEWTRERIEEAGRAIVEMIRRRDVEAWGRFCDRDQGTELSGRAPITDNGSFLAEPLFVDPCEDVIRTEFANGDGQFNPVDQEYRDVVLNRTQFLEAIKLKRPSPQAEGAAIGSTGAIQRNVRMKPIATGAPGRPTSMHLVERELDRRIAAGDSWPSKVSGAEELSEWLRINHKLAPRLTPKTIKNRLGHKLPISTKP